MVIESKNGCSLQLISDHSKSSTKWRQKVTFTCVIHQQWHQCTLCEILSAVRAWPSNNKKKGKKTVKPVCSPSWRDRYIVTHILVVIMFAYIIGMGKWHLNLNDQRSSFYFRRIPLLSLRKYYFTDLSCEHCLLFSSNTKLPSGSWDEKVTPSHSKVFTWIKIEASTILSWFDWEWERERGK